MIGSEEECIETDEPDDKVNYDGEAEIVVQNQDSNGESLVEGIGGSETGVGDEEFDEDTKAEVVNKISKNSHNTPRNGDVSQNDSVSIKAVSDSPIYHDSTLKTEKSYCDAFKRGASPVLKMHGPIQKRSRSSSPCSQETCQIEIFL